MSKFGAPYDLEMTVQAATARSSYKASSGSVSSSGSARSSGTRFSRFWSARILKRGVVGTSASSFFSLPTKDNFSYNRVVGGELLRPAPSTGTDLDGGGPSTIQARDSFSASSFYQRSKRKYRTSQSRFNRAKFESRENKHGLFGTRAVEGLWLLDASGLVFVVVLLVSRSSDVVDDLPFLRFSPDKWIIFFG